MHTPPVSAMRKFAPLTPNLDAQKLLAQIAPRRIGQVLRRVAQVGQIHLALKDRADLLAVLVQRGSDDVRGLFMAELNDEFGEIGLVAREFPAASSAWLRLDLFGGHRLDLDALRSRRGCAGCRARCGWRRRHPRPNGRALRRAVQAASNCIRYSSR